MRISDLEIRDVRNLEHVSVAPGAGVNWFFGPNGAGKTSVLEAIHVLARGRSFRASSISPVIRDGAKALMVAARLADPKGRVGVERQAGGWRGRIDRLPNQKLSDFAQALPLVLIDPENHQLLEGAPSVRRSFLDWGLFHVEQSYLADWKRYSRLLRQRNAALRHGAGSAMLGALEAPMGTAAARVEQLRREYVARLAAQTAQLQQALAFRLPNINLEYRPLADDAESYCRRWRDGRSRDLEQGFTRDGPQRGELAIRAGGRPAGTRFSRGQMKLGALVLKLAQMQVARGADQLPLVLLDDPVSELDRYHLERLLEWLGEQPNQAWVTAVGRPGDKGGSPPSTMFHVEQGKIDAVV
ncbi:MAG: DNA replication/repair protein RecF [Wenzhouxiangellaceae bacterium]|nr:DNA replication/repair protein RecF [Wenzhouxiangellaceae bacterium]